MSEGKIAVSYVVNNSEFNSKISQMKMNLGLLQTEVKNSAKEINLYGDNLKTLGSKQSALNDAINQSKKIIDTYNTSIEKNKVSLANNQEQLTKLSSRKKEVNAQYKEAVKLYGEESSQAKSLKEQLDAVTEEYRNMNTRIATNKDNIVKHTAQMEKQRGTLLTLENDLKNVNKAIEDQSNKFLNASKRFSEASSTLEKVGSGMSDIGGKIAMLSSPLLLFGTYASNAGITFEKNMSQVSATAGLASDDVKYLSERAKQLGEDIRGANATDIAASYQYLALAGQSVGEMYQTIEPYTKAAIAYGEDQKRVTDLGTDSMSALRLETEKTYYYLNVLTKAQNKSNTTATQLMEAYIACGGTLANMNVPLEESATLLGRMADQGTKGSEAGNALNSILVNLMGTTSTTEGALKKLGVETYDSTGKFRGLTTVLQDIKVAMANCTEEQRDMIAAQLGGKTQLTALNQLLNGLGDGYDNLYNAVSNADGALDKMYETMSANTKGNIEELKSKLEALGISFSDKILPFVNKFIDKAKELIDWFGNLSDENQQLIINIGLLSAATGGALKVIGSLTTGLSGLVGAGGKALSWISKYTTSTSAATTAMNTAAKSTTVLKTGLGLMSGISMSALVAGIAGVGTALGVGVYAWHEYNDVMDSTVTKAKEDYGLMERALASLNGITLKTKEELISSGDVYREWGNKVSEATTDTLETITTGVNDINLAIQGANFNGIIDDNELSAITEKVNTFCQNIISSIENNQDPAYEAMKNMFNIDGIIDEQEQAVLDSMKKGTTEAIQGIQERANRINEILTNAKNNNVGLTEEEYSEILRLEQEMGQALIDRLNLEAEEKLQAQQGFWDRYQVNTTEGLSNILKAEYEAKEKNIEAINEKYNAMIEAAEIGMSTLSGEELAFAQEKLQNVIKQRDAEINIEETLWQDKISMAENNYSSLMEKINKFNGEELTNQDMKKQKILKNLEEQYAGMSTITESGWYNIENTVTGKTTEMYVEVDKNTKEVIGVFNTMNGTVGGYSKEIANNVGSMAKEIQIKEDIIKNSINNASNVWVDASNNIMNKNGEIIGNLQEVSENADGTKSALMEIGNKKYSVDIDTSGAISKLDSLSMSVKNFVSNVGSKISNAIGSIGDFITGNRETGGSVLEAGLYNINEAGVELIDTPSNSRAINLGEVTRGELAYIPANSYVTNATMTTRKMSNMIDSKLSSSMSIYANNVNKAIIEAFKGIENEKNIIINMYNSNFVDKGSEDANKSYLRNIFNSAK